ncbi:hypothetical protein NQZ68_040412, partial [Dissostichus eleginoides]
NAEMSASILMYTTCLGLRLTSSSSSHCRDIPVLFWVCVYTATDCPALPICLITLDSGEPLRTSQYACVAQKEHEK